MDPTQLQPGYRLDRYELLCPLAYGGMASVWLARFGGRLGFERMVVIKMILPQFSQDPRFKEMFLDEARIASRIQHSNVARILDIGEHQDNYFIVMEWVDGDSLSKVIRAAEQRKQRVPVGIVMRVIADAAAGLHAAHELKDRDGHHLGVVHRDVSPQNILIANGGSTVIIDFGVAKARDRVSQDTSAGQLKGKIRYMAPEQALGRPIDHRADVWALGAMLYEMFTGSPPYDGPNEVATLHKLTSGRRPPAMPRNAPEVLRAVVDRALGYEPEQRFSSALELNLALEGAMVEMNEPTTAAIVAHYTGQLLADRKAARKRAVDTALEAAKKRDVGVPAPSTAVGAVGLPLSSGPFPLPTPSSARLIEPTAQTEAAAATTPLSGLSEIPSTTSSETLGAANIEYLPAPIVDEGARRRRYLTAAAVGVSGAIGLVGALLILTSVTKHDSARSAELPQVTPEAVSALPTTSASPAAPPVDPPVATAAPTPAPSPVTPTSAAPTAAPASTTPTATHSDGPTTPPRTTTPVHKPVVVVPPKPIAPPPAKPTPAPPPASTKDRGF